MLDNFIGTYHNLATEWFGFMDVDEYKNKPIHYLEIGSSYGGNVLTVSKTYCSHSNSKLYCIYNWEEYRNPHNDIYNSFMQNIQNAGLQDKIIIHRGDSNILLPKLHDLFFDIIYIDGSYEPEYILQHAVFSFRKLKDNGIMVVDYSGWKNHDLMKRGINIFLSAYHGKIQYIGENDFIGFFRKIAI